MWPAELDGSRMIAHKSYMDTKDFKKQRNTTFVVVTREERRVVAAYESRPFFCFHTVKYFDTEDGIYIGLFRLEDISIFADSVVENLRYNEICPELTVARYKLENLSYAITAGPRDIQEASERCVFECKLEFSRVHPRLMRKVHFETQCNVETQPHSQRTATVVQWTDPNHSSNTKMIHSRVIYTLVSQ